MSGVKRQSGGSKRSRRSHDITDDQILNQQLQPLWNYINKKTAIEVFVNAPKQVIVDERGRGKKHYTDKELTVGYFKNLMATLANHAGLTFSADNPILSTTLPGKHRFQCAIGPSNAHEISLAIRCKHPFKATYSHFGLEGEPLPYLRDMMKAEKTIVIAGSTNTGKTTLLNLLLGEFDADRRIITLEDTQELDTERFSDRVVLLAARDEESSAPGKLTYRTLYDHCMRLSPELVVFGEISTSNAFAALGLLNTGHRGFVCTIHADRPDQVISRKFSQNVAWSGKEKMDDIPEYLRDMVDLVVQIKRSPDGMRVVTEMLEPLTNKVVYLRGENS
jgi:pilus assembly protein CpaF